MPLLYPEDMRGAICRPLICRHLVFLVATLLAMLRPSIAQQAPDSFHWVDFHSSQDQDVIAWVTRSLEPEKWTAIREIGVQYDAALVVTTLRANPQGAVGTDTFNVWSVSLTSHAVLRLLQGADLRLLDWIQLTPGRSRELGALYDDCSACNASTFFTVFYYDITQHGWGARWLHGNQAVTVHSANPPPGVTWTQVFAVLADPSGNEFAGSWTHFDYGAQKPAEDYVYQYDIDPWHSLDRVQQVSDKQAAAMEQRLCSAQDAVPGFADGQDSQLCRDLLHPRPVHENEKPCKCRDQVGPARPGK